MTVSLGTDTSGRPILVSPLMAAWWEGLLDRLPYAPTIVQGAYMARAGGGADASAGYHDGSGCLDLRTWDRTGSELRLLVSTLRAGGAGAWLRDRLHGGMDPHIHLVLGADLAEASSGARWQWAEYVAGRDGLASRGPDYHPRPDPLVTEIPEDWTMPTADEIATAVWSRGVKPVGGSEPLRADAMLAQTHNRAGATRDVVREVRQALRGLTIPGVDGATVQAAVDAALRDVLGSLDET